MVENGVTRAETVIEGIPTTIDTCGIYEGENMAWGDVLESLQTSVYAEGFLVAVAQTPVAGHGIGLHAEGVCVMQQSSPTVKAEGHGVCKEGHQCNCGGLATGCDSVFIGD